MHGLQKMQENTRTPLRPIPSTRLRTLRRAVLCLAALGAAPALWAQAAKPAAPASGPQARPVVGHLKLQNSLDRPQDGYCLDVVGSGKYIRFDLPLTAHNCKPGLYHDEAVEIDASSRIHFVAYGACATVAGLNGRALPGAALVPRECDEKTPFMDARALQRFHFRADGLIELQGSGLCLTVSDESDWTFERTHRWRPLFVARCATVKPELSRWKFVPYQPA